MMYHAVVKKSGKLWTVATWTGSARSCLRLAQVVFQAYGVDASDVRWDSVVRQKNWNGYSDGCVHLNCTQEQADEMWRASHRKREM